MDSMDLRCLSELARQLSFTKAAARLNLSQPALSKRLKRLEDELGVRLFDRTTTSVVLTSAGAQVVGSAMELLSLWQRVEECARFAAGEPIAAHASPLRLGVFAEYDGRLATHLGDLLVGVPVDLTVLQPPDALRALGDGQLDAAMIYELPDVPSQPSVAGAHSATLVSEAQWVVLGRSHPLAGREEVTVGKVADYATPWFVSPPGHPIRAWETNFLVRSCDRVIMRTVDDTSLHRIARGNGAALASPQNVPSTDLVLLPLTPTVTWHHYVTWMPERLPLQVSTALRKALHAFELRQAQRHVKYWSWLHDDPVRTAALAMW